LTEIEELWISHSRGIKGPGLKHLKGMSKFRNLGLEGTQIDDAGLVGVKDLTQLRALSLPPGVGDAGFVHLAGLTDLEQLSLFSLPKLTGPGLKHLAKLEKVTELNLAGTGVTDAGLASVKALRQLRRLTLPAGVSDEGLVHLAEMTGLEELSLGGQEKLTGVGLKHLAKLSKVKNLYLGGTGVTDDGLAGLTGLKQLDSLSLPERIGDRGLAHLAALHNLRYLHLDGTQVTDAGLIHLLGLKKLQGVYLERTRVTPKGVEKLKTAFPMATVEGP
jgi:hypothetical protein